MQHHQQLSRKPIISLRDPHLVPELPQDLRPLPGSVAVSRPQLMRWRNDNLDIQSAGILASSAPEPSADFR